MSVKVKKFRFLEGDLAGDVYFQRGREEFAGNALFLYGFPSFPGPNAAIEQMVSDGFVVISPHYFGTYDSARLFDPAALVDTLRESAQLASRGYLRQAKSGSQFEVAKTWQLCVGHSFGCAAAVRAAHLLKDLSLLMLLAPTAHYQTAPVDYGVREDGFDQLEYVRISHPRTYRLASAEAWSPIFNGTDAPIRESSDLAVANAVAVIGADDAYFDLAAARTNLPGLIRSYAGCPQTRVSVLAGCGHPISELVAAGAFEDPAYQALAKPLGA